MDNNRPLILLTNDDGVQAKGINELVKILSPSYDILVMAPNGARSGTACGITAHDPLWFKVISETANVKICECSGTPVDCVKLALEVFTARRPDLIVSGINHGDNASVSVHYSGTMGAVMEGCMKGVPSIGFSLADFDADADFSATANHVSEIVRKVLDTGLPQGVCLNVNFPQNKGMGYVGAKVCRMGQGAWTNEWYAAEHPKGQRYYWLVGKFTNTEPHMSDTDTWALENNYVAITPIQVDMTAYHVLDKIKHLEHL